MKKLLAMVLALVMALDRAIRNKNTQNESVYEHRGILLI